MLKKKNICIIVDNDFYNDIRVNNQVSYLKNQFNVFVVCFKFNKDAHDIDNDINIIRIKICKKMRDILFGIQNTFPFYDLFLACKIIPIVKKNKIEVIHCHDLYLSNLGFLIKKFTGVKLILDLHENYPEAVLTYSWTQNILKRFLSKPYLWKKKEKQYLSYADKIIVLSESYKRYLIDQYPFLNEKNIEVYANYPDLIKFNSYPIVENIFPKNQQFILFYFGVISERRGIITCINALNLLIEKNNNFHLLLIGPVDKSEIKIFKDLFNKYKKNITHFNWKDISLLPSYINISDVCLSPIVKNPQHESGLANKIFQYSYFEKPIIASDCKPQEDYIKDNQCGLIFKSEDYNDLASKILLLKGNPSLCHKMSLNGRNAVESKYNAQQNQKNLINAYHFENFS